MIDYSIELAKFSDVDEITNLYNELNDYLKENTNYPCWIKDVYPIRETALNGINTNTLYILKSEGRIAASVILNDIQPEAYSNLSWNIEAGGKEVLGIHTLCVHPDFYGKGFASILIDFTEDLAKQINAKTIRFDTHTGNLPAAKLYLKKGYKLIGETPLNLDYDIEDSFKCFEKII